MATVREKTITNTMEPYIAGTLGVLTIGGADGNESVFAARLENTPTQHPEDGTPVITRMETWKTIGCTDEAATVEIPGGEHACYALGLTNSIDPETAWIVNRPRLDWHYPEQAIRGETLRLMGRNLVAANHYASDAPDSPVSYGGYREGVTQVVACRADTADYVTLVVEKANAYEAFVQIPADFPEGAYDIFAHNGSGGVSGWSAPIRLYIITAAPWPSDVFHVDDYLEGKPSGHVNWNIAYCCSDTIPGEHYADEAIAKAIAAAEANGGGVVQFGIGIYDIRETIFVPRKVTLRGRGAKKSWIRTPFGVHACPPWVMITGDGDFAVEDLRLVTFFAPVAIAAPTWLPEDFDEAYNMPHLHLTGKLEARGENVAVRRCHIQQRNFEKVFRRLRDPEFGDEDKKQVDRLMYYSYDRKDGANDRLTANAIQLRGSHMEITDCKVQALAHAISLAGCQYVRIANNELCAGVDGNAIQMFGQLLYKGEGMQAAGRQYGAQIKGYVTEHMLIEDNLMRGTDYRSRNGFFFFQSGMESLVARNKIIEISRITDGEATGYHHFMNRYKNVNINMLSPLEGELLDAEQQFDQQIMEGMGIEVMDGPGVGQLRHIVKHEGNRVWLDKPWAYAPTEESFVTFSAPTPHNKIVFVDNHIEDTGPSFCMWGSCNDFVLDGNYIADGPGITLWSVRHDVVAIGRWGGPKFVQIINNTLDIGMMQPDDKTIPYCLAGSITEQGGIATCGSWNKEDTPYGVDFYGLQIRNNHTTNNSGIYIQTKFPRPTVVDSHQDVAARAAGVVVQDNFASDSQYGVMVEEGVDVHVRKNRARNVKRPLVMFNKDKGTIFDLPQ